MAFTEHYATLIILPLALVLDLVLGDPRSLPHPVRFMGAAIEKGEPLARRIIPNEAIAGIFFVLFLVPSTWIFSYFLVITAYKIHTVCGVLISIVLIYYTISVRSLSEAAMEVRNALKSQSLEEARLQVSRIVGRDVASLSKRGVIRAAVETVAENFVDGVFAPIFFAAIGGAPLAMTYKMINTLDSMIGYKSETYIRFGRAAARLDDAANFIPARLSVPIISLAAHLLYGRGTYAMKTATNEGSHHSSPNAGRPEAAFAGSLGVKLCGPGYYEGQPVHKPFIGVLYGEVELDHIRQACDLMMLSAVLGLVVVWCVSVLVALIF
jgi:adenosylcobinamide-phosphate synthase